MTLSQSAVEALLRQGRFQEIVTAWMSDGPRASSGASPEHRLSIAEALVRTGRTQEAKDIATSVPQRSTTDQVRARIEMILGLAARELGCDGAGLVARDGRIFAREDRSLGLDWAAAARLAFSRSGPLVGTGWYQPPKHLGGDFKGGAVGTSPAYSFSTAIAEVSAGYVKWLAEQVKDPQAS